MTANKFDGTYRPWEVVYHSPLGDTQLAASEWKSVGDILTQTAKNYPERTGYAIVLPSGDICEKTFEEVDALSDRIASYFLNCLGLASGDVVAIQLPNSLHYPIVFFGAMKAGLVVTNVNPLYTPQEVIFQLKDSGAKVLIGFNLFAESIEEVSQEISLRKIVICTPWDFFPKEMQLKMRLFLKHVRKAIPPIKFDHETFERALKKEKKSNFSGNWKKNKISKDSVALLQYTGGTTGTPKGTVLTHGNLLSVTQMNLAFESEMFDQVNQITVLTVVPLYHIFGVVLSMLLFTAIVGKNIFVPNPRPIDNLLPAFKKYSVDWIIGVDTLFSGLLAQPWFQELAPRIDVALTGGAKLQPDTQKLWQSSVGAIMEGYGLTETSCVISINPPDDRARPGTVGVPVPGLNIRVENDAGEPVGIGEPGELWVSGPNVTTRYHKLRTSAVSAFREKWFATGDIVSIDQDGYITILERAVDVINVSGFNVYPSEIEDVIAKLDYVADVAVVGVKHPKTGEVPKAFVVATRSPVEEQEILSYCKKHLTGPKVPSSVEFRKELPKSIIGKTLRKELRSVNAILDIVKKW